MPSEREELAALVAKMTPGEWEYSWFNGIKGIYSVTFRRDADANGIIALRNKWPQINAIWEAAECVKNFNWGTGVSEAYHFERMAAMDRLRTALAGEEKDAPV